MSFSTVIPAGSSERIASSSELPVKATDAKLSVLDSLGALCELHGRSDLALRLEQTAQFLQEDLASVDEVLEGIEPVNGTVGQSASELVQRAGKRLRPLCVALAARLGGSFDLKARELAVAIELVHSATLLHDDVVDGGEFRRGSPTARLIYGNAASIFAGDWLLVEALRRVQRVGHGELLGDLLATIEEMIAAESLQLGFRGRADSSWEVYYRVIDGKTAALFRWGLRAGAAVGCLSATQHQALQAYGTELGVAFQLIDDLLDYVGNAAETGKSMMLDLREGKLTYPLLAVLDGRPQARRLVEQGLAGAIDEGELALQLSAWVDAAVVGECRAEARRRALRAQQALRPLDDSVIKQALMAVAEASVLREA